MANADFARGFRPLHDIHPVPMLPVAATTFGVGDPLVMDAGKVKLGLTGNIVGVAAEACAAGVPAGGLSTVMVWPARDGAEFIVQCSGTPALATELFKDVDLEGTTGIVEADEDSTTYGVFKITALHPATNNDWGAHADVIGRFNWPEGDDHGVAFIADTSYGLVVASGKIRVDLEPNGAGTGGLEFTGGDLQIDCEAAGVGTGGLALVAGGVRVLLDPAGVGTGGIEATATGLRADIEAAGAGTGGLALVADGLQVLTEAAGVGTGGLAQVAGGMRALCDGAHGIALGASGIEAELEAAGAGTGGLAVGAGGLSVLTEAAGVGTGGLAQVAGGMRALCDGAHGIALGASGIEAELDVAGALSVGAGGLAVAPDNASIGITGNTLAVKTYVVCSVDQLGGANTFTLHGMPCSPVAGTLTGVYVTSSVGTADGAGNLWVITVTDGAGNQLCGAGWDTNADGNMTAHVALDMSAKIAAGALLKGEQLVVTFTETGAATDQSAAYITVLFEIQDF